MKNPLISFGKYFLFTRPSTEQKRITVSKDHLYPGKTDVLNRIKSACINPIYFVVILFFSLPVQVFSQCTTGCNQSVTTNVMPGTNGFSNIFCISTLSTLTYNQNFDMNGGTTCVGPNVTFNASGGNWLGSWTVNNYGNFSRGISLGSGQVFNNYGNFTGSVSLGIGGTIVNYNGATFNPSSFNFNGGSFTNNTGGTATFGFSVTVNSGCTFINNGSLTATGLTLNSSANATLGGSTTINGNVTNNGTIAISGVITVTGNYSQNSSGVVNSQTGSQCNSLNVTGTIQGQGTYNGSNGLLLTQALTPACPGCLVNGTSTSPPGQPANQISGPTLTSSGNSISGTITNPGGSPAATNYIVLRRFGTTVSDQPANYTNYAVGAVIGNSVVVAVNPIATLTFTDANVIASNGCGTYYYAVFPFSASGSCGRYNRTVNATNRSSIAIASTAGTVSSSTSICSGNTSGSLTLSGYTGSVVRWEYAISPFSSWTSIANTTNTYTSGTLTQTTQFRAVVNAGSGCSNVNSTAATITVNPLPSVPAGTSASRCGNGTVTLTATPGAGETIDWYAAPSGGTALLVGNSSYTTSPLSSTTIFYAESRKTATGCVSASRTAVTATINSLPAVPSGTGTSRCGNGTVTLTATPAVGETIDWYAAASGGAALLSGSNSYTTTSLSSTTIFYAESRNTTTNCVSASRVAVTATVNPLPSVTLTGSTNVCSGTTSLTLAYSSPVNSPDQYSIDWSAAANAAGMVDVGFTTLSGGNITLTGLTSTAGNYMVDIYIKNSVTGCQSNISSGTVCGMVAENATLSLSVPNGSVFNAINFASYGTPTGSCGSFATGACHATNSLSIVQAAAIGQSSFSIAATNAVFTDPCVGTVKNLYVEAAYGFAISISPALSASITGTTTICTGSSTTLSAPVAPHYVWNTGDTTQTITVSPTTNTTYSVTISNTACSSSASQLVTVNSVPSVTLVTTAPAVCAGVTSTVLIYNSPVNSPDRYSIAWSAAGIAAGLSNVTNATLSGGTITLSGITSTPGNYGATVTISNSSTGCYSTIASGSICGTVNENVTLSMTAPGGAKFIGINFASYGTPTGSCGSFATSSCHAATSLAQVQAAAIGNTTFSIAASNGVFGDPCSGTVKRLYVDAAYSIFSLTVNAIPAAPTAGSNSPVCSGNTINLTASVVAGATYSWTGPSGYTSSSQNPSITSALAGMSGTYSVRSTVAGCNSATTGNVSVVVNTAPSATISYAGSPYCSTITSGPVTLTGTSGGAFTAPASLNINSSSGVINPSLSTVGGPYTVTYTIAAAGGCSLFSTTTPVTILGIPTATTVAGAGTFCTNRTITASGGTGGTIYFQGTTSGGTSTATASTSQVVTSSGTYYFRAKNASGCWGTEGSVVVVIKAVPTCSGASLSSNYCSGSPATINLTGLVAGSTNTISYTINGVAQTPVSGVVANGSGAASFNTGSLTIVNNGQTLQVTNINNGTCSTAFSYNVTLVINPANTWLGFNTNWNDALNWCGSVPAGTANVVFPSGVPFYPVISSGAIQANNITIAPGASVTVTNAVLRISGTISNSGVLTASSGTLELNGSSSSQTIAGSMFAGKTVQDLKISNSNGVSLSGTNDTLKISGLVSFGTSNAVLTTNGNLTLLSSATGTASVGDMTNGGANNNNNVTGNVTVEHYIPNHSKAWQFLAIPTNGQTINAAWQEGNSPLGNTRPGYGAIITSNVSGAVGLGFDIYTLSSPSMKTYNTATASWDGVLNPSLPIANKKGYMLFVRGDRSVTAYNQSATSTILRSTGSLYTIGANAPSATTIPAGKLESVGNPYASAIDFTLLTKTGSVDNKFYVWDPLLTNTYNGYGGYQSISATNGWKPVPGGTANYDATVACKTIQSGQAFFVYSSGSGGTVSFTESCKVNGSALVNRPVTTTSGRQSLRLSLYNANSILSDGNIVAFDPDFSNDYNGDDALKISNTGENIGIKRGDNLLAIEARSPVAAEDTVFYNFSGMKLQSYQLRFYPENLSSGGLTAMLVDKFLNNITPISLADSSSVNFNITTNAASYAADRFYVIFKQAIVLPVTITRINAAYKQKDIAVNWNVENETSMKQYEVEHSIDGRNFTRINTTLPAANTGGATHYQYIHLAPPVSDNFYRIKALSAGGLVQYSAIVKVSPEKQLPGITVYPNPVTGNTVQLQFSGQPSGKYDLILVHNNGMTQQLKSLQLNSSQSTETVLLPQLLASGTYNLKVIGPDGSVIVKTLHIIQ